MLLCVNVPLHLIITHFDVRINVNAEKYKKVKKMTYILNNFWMAMLILKLNYLIRNQ